MNTPDDRPRIERLADDVRAKMLAHPDFISASDGELVIRITPPKTGDGPPRIRLEGKT